jgi:hypothetical protein
MDPSTWLSGDLCSNAILERVIAAHVTPYGTFRLDMRESIKIRVLVPLGE